jgi:hypothetical protein
MDYKKSDDKLLELYLKFVKVTAITEIFLMLGIDFPKALGFPYLPKVYPLIQLSSHIDPILRYVAVPIAAGVTALLAGKVFALYKKTEKEAIE